MSPRWGLRHWSSRTSSRSSRGFERKAARFCSSSRTRRPPWASRTAGMFLKPEGLSCKGRRKTSSRTARCNGPTWAGIWTRKERCNGSEGGMYWEPDKECMDREELEQLQLERLQSTLNRVYAHVPFYRKKFDALGIARQEIQDALGIVATDNYGLSEVIGPGVSGECLERNGLHINEEVVLVDVQSV